MELFLTLFTKTRFTLELVALTALYAYPLPKRSRFPLRFAAGLAGCLALSLLFPESVIQFYLAIVPIFLLTWLCCELSLLDAVYCVCCGYATQHFFSCLYNALCILGMEENASTPPRVTPLYCLFFLVTAVVFYLVFARRIGGPDGFLVSTRPSTISIAVILLAVLILSSIRGNPVTIEETHFYLLALVYDMLCCLIILWMQVSQVNQAKLQRDVDMQQRLMEEQKEQYALTKETIDLINRKCHDIKHQLAALQYVPESGERDRYLQEVGETVQIYDSTLQTGSEVLDTVLTENSLLCEARGITLTCVADGARLSFLNAVDLYTIFGNALDNAVEYVSSLEDPEQRIISVSIWGENGLVMIQIDNPCEEAPAFADGLPSSTKEKNGYHGFGLKSIRQIAEKYDGQMTVRVEDGLFVLRVSFPDQT